MPNSKSFLKVWAQINAPFRRLKCAGSVSIPFWVLYLFIFAVVFTWSWPLAEFLIVHASGISQGACLGCNNVWTGTNTFNGNVTGGAASNVDLSGVASLLTPAYIVRTDTNSTMNAGKGISFTSSATTGSLRLVGSAYPTGALLSGQANLDLNGNDSFFDGMNWRLHPYFPCADPCVGTPSFPAGIGKTTSGGLMSLAVAGTDYASPSATNAQTTTYSVTTADFAACRLIQTASASFTITLLASAPPDGQCIRILNYGSGLITIARNGLNINGVASNVGIFPATSNNPHGMIITSNGSSYFAQSLSDPSAGLLIADANNPPSANELRISSGNDMIRVTGDHIWGGANVDIGISSSDPSAAAPTAKFTYPGFANAFGMAGNLQWINTVAQPTCDVTHRGLVWYVAGATSVKDTFNFCAKDAGDAYAWRTIY